MFSSKNSLNYVSILLIIHHKKPLEIEFLGFATFAGLFYAKLGYGYVLFSEKKSHQMDQKELYATLEKNISKLQRCNKKLSVLLEQESLRPEIWDLVPTHDGNYTCRIVHENGSRLVNSAYKPWDEAGKDLLRFFIGRDARYVYYFGMGLGYHLKLLLERLPPGVVVHLVEDELKWLVLAFAIHDFSKNIQEQTLVVHTRGEFRLWNFSFRQNDTIWIHPVLGEAALVPLKPELFPEVRENRRSVCIVSLFNYGGYKNLSDRCASVFEDKGWQVSYAEPSKEEVERKIEEQYVTLLFSLSFSLTLSFLAMNRKIPYLCWELDKNVNPDVVNPAYISPHTYIYTTYKADVEKYIGAGANARFLPAAPNILLPESYKLSPREKEKYECDISFVGSPLITINNEYRKLKGELLEIFKGANKKEQGEIIAFNRKLDTILEKQNRYSLKNVFRLHQIFEEEMVLLPSGISIHLDHLKSILAKECCRYQRHQYLRRLDPLVVTIYGNSDWNNVNERNFRYRGEADFDYESGKIYLASKINIDITRVYTLDGFSDRVFNVLSRGGFLLINRTEALSQFFEDGKELVFFDSPGDLKEKCCYYLNAEDERKEIAERGKNRVRRFHNVESRVTEMLSELDAHEGVFTAKNADLYPSIGDIVPGKKQPEVVGKLS